MCSRYPVLFVKEPLVVKYGGHDDQLSRRYWGMDRFRVHAIDKILAENILSPRDREAAVCVLLEKAEVYIEGARKRGKTVEAEEYEALREKYRGLSSGDRA